MHPGSIDWASSSLASDQKLFASHRHRPTQVCTALQNGVYDLGLGLSDRLHSRVGDHAAAAKKRAITTCSQKAQACRNKNAPLANGARLETLRLQKSAAPQHFAVAADQDKSRPAQKGSLSQEAEVHRKHVENTSARASLYKNHIPTYLYYTYIFFFIYLFLFCVCIKVCMYCFLFLKLFSEPALRMP